MPRGCCDWKGTNAGRAFQLGNVVCCSSVGKEFNDDGLGRYFTVNVSNNEEETNNSPKHRNNPTPGDCRI